MREFTKPTTNVGGSTGLIIPDWICKADKIHKGTPVRILIEPMTEGLNTDQVAPHKSRVFNEWLEPQVIAVSCEV